MPKHLYAARAEKKINPTDPVSNNSFALSVTYSKICIFGQYVNPVLITVFRIEAAHKGGYHIAVRRDAGGIRAHDIQADPLKTGQSLLNITIHGKEALPMYTEEKVSLLKMPADDIRVMVGNAFFQDIFPKFPVEGLQSQFHFQVKTGERLP